MTLVPLDFEGFQVTKTSSIEGFVGETVTAACVLELADGPAYDGCDYQLTMPVGVGKVATFNHCDGTQFSTSSGTWYGLEAIWRGSSSSNMRQLSRFLDFADGDLRLEQGSDSDHFECQIFDKNGSEVSAYVTAPSDDPFVIDHTYRIQVLYFAHGTTGQCKVRAKDITAGDTGWTTICESDANQNMLLGSSHEVILRGATGSTASPPILPVVCKWQGFYIGSMTETDWSDFLTNPEFIRFSVHRTGSAAADCDRVGTNPGDSPSAGTWDLIGAEDSGTGDKDVLVSQVDIANGDSGAQRTIQTGPDEGSLGLSARENGPYGHDLIGADWTPIGARCALRTAGGIGNNGDWIFGKATNDAAAGDATYTIHETGAAGSGNVNHRSAIVTSGMAGLDEYHVIGIAADATDTMGLSAAIVQELFDKPDAGVVVLRRRIEGHA